MYLKRNKAARLLPIPRKGTKYIARARSNFRNGVPIVIAIRDMLGFAKTSDEVKKMVKYKLIKLNGKLVEDIRETIQIFNILESDKKYKLTVLPTQRFLLEETKDSGRLCKVINKKIQNNGHVQLNFHDGTNIVSKEKIKVGDSVFLDFNNKITKVLNLDKGKDVFVISGKSMGLKGKIKEVLGRKSLIKLHEGLEVELDKSHIIAI
jgi:small subunit ribosomal protein S4e